MVPLSSSVQDPSGEEGIAVHQLDGSRFEEAAAAATTTNTNEVDKVEKEVEKSSRIGLGLPMSNIYAKYFGKLPPPPPPRHFTMQLFFFSSSQLCIPPPPQSLLRAFFLFHVGGSLDLMSLDGWGKSHHVSFPSLNLLLAGD
jgi:hypothetical protein